MKLRHYAGCVLFVAIPYAGVWAVAWLAHMGVSW